MAKGIAIASLVFTSLAIATSAFSQYIPRWNEINLDTAAVSGHHGLYRVHLGTEESDWIKSLSSNKGYARSVRYLMAAGGALMVVSLILILVFVCLENKRVAAILAAVINFMAVGTHVAAITIFYVKFDNSNDGASLAAGFWLAIVAACLALIGVILKLIAAISGGAKVDTFGNKAMSAKNFEDKRGYPPPTTRVSYNARAGNRRR